MLRSCRVTWPWGDWPVAHGYVLALGAGWSIGNAWNWRGGGRQCGAIPPSARRCCGPEPPARLCAGGLGMWRMLTNRGPPRELHHRPSNTEGTEAIKPRGVPEAPAAFARPGLPPQAKLRPPIGPQCAISAPAPSTATPTSPVHLTHIITLGRRTYIYWLCGNLDALNCFPITAPRFWAM